jgi:hypothetical protein
LTGLLIVVFGGDSHALIPLFAVGVFLAFTLSQSGMVVHWFKLRGPQWRLKALANGVGALVTTATFLIVAVSKFAQGAWIVLVLIPAMAIIFRRINMHYQDVAKELTLRACPEPAAFAEAEAGDPHFRRAPRRIEAVRYARSVSDRITAVYVETEPGAAERTREEWERWGLDIPLDIVPSPYRSIIGPLLEYLDGEDTRHNDGQQATVVLPEFVPARWWQTLLHNQTAFLLKLALVYRRRRFEHSRPVIDVPYYLRD